MDYDKWTTADLLRYQALLRKQLDAAVLPECALTHAEQRELERFRLGLVSERDEPVPVNDEHFSITERVFVEQDGTAPLRLRPATDAPDTEPGLPVLSPAPAAAAPPPEPPLAPTLRAEDWDACGIFEINGIPSTTYGDARAQQILSGGISYDDAVREEQQRQRVNAGWPGIQSPYL